MALTLPEKARVRHHLGYPQLTTAPLLALGVRAAGHTAFLVEAAMNELLPEAEPTFRNVLSNCDCIEAQITEARQRIKVKAVGDVALRGREEFEDLVEQYDHWTDKLADLFAAEKNPFSKTHQGIHGDAFLIQPG